jgi:CHAT domain-containing protein
LFASEITAERLRNTGVVVLATCEGAAGRVVEGEGALSVARAFFAAGVPAVIASMWPVPDDVPGFAMTLHRELTAGTGAASALRRAQLALLDERGPAAPVIAWGGFIMFGGFGPVS